MANSSDWFVEDTWPPLRNSQEFGYFIMIAQRSICCSAVFLALCTGPATGHDGPDPVLHWQMNSKNLVENRLQARLGPQAVFSQVPRIIGDPLGESIGFNGRDVECVVAEDYREILEYLPSEAFTVSAWVAIDEPTEWGGIVGTILDNGGHEQGWLLGYDKHSRFSFALSTANADDGDGKLTYLKSNTKFELGKLVHVAAVYDGTTMQLFVNGKLDANSSEQMGTIVYPDSAPFVIGAFRDTNEFHPLKGRIRDIAIYASAAKSKWIETEYAHNHDWTRLPKIVRSDPQRFVVKPYLQFATETSITVMWRAARSGPGKVHWGETFRCRKIIESNKDAEIHEVKIEGLQPETQYFYWVESIDVEGNPIESDVSTFQTVSKFDTPFAFAVIGDTQSNPKVNGAIAHLAWAHRPNFLLHPGDLVNQGTMADDWVDEFFASMHPLLSRVAMYPVLGNHEQNARNYFDYMSLPEPEYYYQFRYGNSDFFMIDSNRNVDSESEQYRWLDKALADSQATWKFVCHHHPPYSSDENDYGDLWKTNKSTRGDARLRPLVALYEKHNVDIVWTGHIHSYERTWPILQERAVEVGGTIYMITGGGGGSLETPGPYRPYFQNNVRRGHHYVMVAINGSTLELKAFSLEDELFDVVSISKN